MNRINTYLSVALAAQIVIAIGLYSGNQQSAEALQKQVLLDTGGKSVEQVVLSKANENDVVLSQLDGKWILSGYHQLPANQGKVNQLLNKLETTQYMWPVTTTTSSHARFKVAEDNFNIKIALSSDKQGIQTLYLGSSPGFRQLHVRQSDSDEVYSVKLNSVDFPVKNSDWLDKTLLQMNTDMTAISGTDFSLEKDYQQSWKLAQGDGEIDKTEIGKLVNTLKQLHVQSVSKKTFEKSDYDLVVKNSNATFTYQLFKDDNNHFIKRNDHEQTFKISPTDYDKIAKLDATKLVKQVNNSDSNKVTDRTETDQTNKEDIKAGS